MSEVELVRVGPEDWELFREVRLRSLADAPAAFGSRFEDWVKAPDEAWRDRLTSVPLTLLARQGAEVTGVVSGSLHGVDAVELISMWVAEHARGTGVAHSLIDAVLTWAGDRGRRTFLMVRADNERAVAAYRRAGFVDRGVPHDHPADRPPEHRMEHPGPIGAAAERRS